MSVDASSLHCPNCGAPAEPDTTRCRYCKVRLATVSCPSCFALMFEGTAFCPKCGAKGARSTADTATPLKCPECKKPMQALDIGSVSMFECTSCDGIWLDAKTFEEVCADTGAQGAVIHRFADHTPRPAPARVKYRPCPRCANMMNRVNFGRISGIVVDVCRGHGTYLDPGELHAIIAFINAGGLERAREQRLEELKEQERRVEEAEQRLARERRRSDPHHHSGIRWEWHFMIGDD